MREVECEQGSAEWLEARRGVITATKAAALLARNSRGWAASRARVIAELAMERLHAEPPENRVSAAMVRGTELEGDARTTYEMERACEVETIGFCLHDRFDRYGASPDGLVGDDGGVEFKVPDSVAKMVGYLDDPAALRAEYEGQAIHNLFVTGRKWWHIAAYDPRAPGGLNLAITTVNPPTDWAAYEAELATVDAEIDALVASLDAKRSLAA